MTILDIVHEFTALKCNIDRSKFKAITRIFIERIPIDTQTDIEFTDNTTGK